jgi:hypothetical protein
MFAQFTEGTLSHDEEQLIGEAVARDVQLILTNAGLASVVVQCFYVSYGMPGNVVDPFALGANIGSNELLASLNIDNFDPNANRERRDFTRDPSGLMLQIALQSPEGTPFDQIELAQNAIMRSVYTGLLKPDVLPQKNGYNTGGHSAAAYLLPITTTSSTTTTTTTRPAERQFVPVDKKSETSVILGIGLSSVLLIALCIGIMYRASHVEQGTITHHHDVRAKHASDAHTRTSSAHYHPPAHGHDTDIEHGEYRVPEVYAHATKYAHQKKRESLEYQQEYGVPTSGGATDDQALAKLMGSMWDDKGGLYAAGSMAPTMMPDPLNSAYSTAYTAAPYLGGDYANNDLAGALAPWGAFLAPGGGAPTQQSHYHPGGGGGGGFGGGGGIGFGLDRGVLPGMGHSAPTSPYAMMGSPNSFNSPTSDEYITLNDQFPRDRRSTKTMAGLSGENMLAGNFDPLHVDDHFFASAREASHPMNQSSHFFPADMIRKAQSNTMM